MYWTHSTQVSSISNIMPINRFENIRQYFHCNDNSKNVQPSDPNQDKLYQVGSVPDSVLKKCRQILLEEVHLIDEQIIPTKGCSSIKQYLLNKPNKWGMKVWGRCGISGVVYDFEVYSGKNNTKKDNEIEGILMGEMLCTVSHEHCYSMKIRRYSLTISFHQLLCSSY